MGNGSDTPNTGGASNGFFRRFDSALENRMVMLFTALVLATGGSIGINKLTPDVRSDPFTGTMARQLETRVMNAVIEMDAKSEMRHLQQDDRIDGLEKLQALDNQHRVEAVEGYQRIRVLEVAIAAQTQAQVDTKDEIRLLRADMQRLLERLLQVE